MAALAPLHAAFIVPATIGLPGWRNQGRLPLVGWLVALLGSVGMAAGMALMVWFDSDSGWSVWFFSALAHPVGLLLYGVAAWRRRLTNRWSALPLVMGLAAGPAAVLLSIGGEMVAPRSMTDTDPGFILWAAALGAGWALVGVGRLLPGFVPAPRVAKAWQEPG